MKIKPLLLSVVFVPFVAWFAVDLAMHQIPVHEHSRRMNTNPDYIKSQQESLKLSSQGHSALFHKNYALAEKELRQSLALDASGGDVNTWGDLGRALDEQGRSEEAYNAYREAYDSPTRGGSSNFPNDVETLTHYGIMCEDHSQHEAAVRAYNKAAGELNPRQIGVALNVSSDPRKIDAPHLRALLDVMRGLTIGEEKNLVGGQDRKEEALEAFQEAAQQQPNDARIQYYLGYGYQKAGQFSQAHAAFQKAATLDTQGTVKAAATESLRAVQAHQR